MSPATAAVGTATHEGAPETRRGAPPIPRWRIYVGLFSLAVALRAITASAIALTSGLSLRNLSVFYDGHLYVLISRTLPRLYLDVGSIFPEFPRPSDFLTGWFPAYPLSIRLWATLTGDPLLAALIAAWTAGGLAVVLFYELARDYVESPGFAAVLFSFLPFTWLLGGSLALVESTYVCLLLACILALQRGRIAWAALFAALTVLAQKSGVLLLPILIAGARPRSRALWPCVAAVGAAVALQGYLWGVFGDPFVNARVLRPVFGSDQGLFGFPFAGFVSWMMEPGSLFRGLFWQRKAVIFAEAAIYVGLFLWAAARPASRKTLPTAWLGVTLLFHASLTGMFSFYAFPRYMVMASPAAILLGCRLVPSAGRWRWAALGVLLPLTVIWTVADSLDALELCVGTWTPEYFRALVRALR